MKILLKVYTLMMLLWPLCIVAQPYSLIRQIRYEQGLPNNYVLGITQDKRGYLWFATDEGLSRYDGVRFINFLKDTHAQTPLLLSGNSLNCVMDDPQSPFLWIGTQTAGLNCYDYENNTFRIYCHDDKDPNSLTADGITCLAPARDGNLWVCTYYKGVDYFNKKSGKFIHYNSETLGRGFGDKVWTCAEKNGEVLFIGHEGQGLTVLNLRTKAFMNYRSHPGNLHSLPGNTIRSLCLDTRGQVWLATDGGLAVFNPSTGTFRRFASIPQNCYNVRQVDSQEVWVAPEFGGAVAVNIHDYAVRYFQTTYAQGLYNNWQSLSDQSLRYIYKDKYSNIWLGSWGHGVFMMEHAEPLFRHYLFSAIPSDYFLTNPSVMAVTEDGDGRLWMGTDGGGINVFTGDKRTAVYRQEHPGEKDNCMQAVLRDSKGQLWFGLYNAGVLVFKAGSRSCSQAYPPERAKTDVRSFCEDRMAGLIWVGASGGIDLFERDTHRFLRHIDLPNNLVRTVARDRQGQLWVGTYNGGLFILSPEGKVKKTLDTAHDFPFSTVNQLYMDVKGQMWAGTAGGLLLFPNTTKPERYIVYDQRNELDNNYIRSIVEDRHQRIWISTNQSICCLLPTGKFLCYDAMEGHPFGNFTDRSTFCGRSGRLFFGSVNGLYSFNPDDLLKNRPLPPVMISGLTISGSIHEGEQNDREVFIGNGETARLNHSENTFTVTFNTQDFAFTNRVEYIYKLEGLDNSWYSSGSAHAVTYRNLPPGNYTFIIKAHARNQASYSREAQLKICIAPPFYASWWARLVYVLLIASGIWWLLRFYKKRVHLEYLYASERKSRQQEQELNKERLQFYTNITHELRTPLTLIIGPIEDVEKSPTLAANDRHTITLIHQSALRLLRLINELLEFRKTETGNRQLRVVHGDIVRTIRETILKYMELLRNPAVTFREEFPPGPVVIWYDPEVITIILDNLISNAVKYTKAGSITLAANVTTDGLFKIHVKDTGYGISAAALPHVFDRYYQEKSSHQASGTGIGLALVRNLALLHGGHIAVSSEEGKGSCFTLSLSLSATYPNAVHIKEQVTAPVIAAGTNMAEQNSKVLDSSKKPAGRPVVLVVEDNPDIRTYIAGALSDDFAIHTAANGREGEEIALKIAPDIIVSDILMPEMNGYEMCRALKANVQTSHIPVILLTAKTAMEDKMEGYEVGADSYITKPFSATLLKSRIENLIAQRKALFSNIDPLLKAGRIAMEEKRTTFEASLSKLDREFLQKLDTLIQENMKSDRLDINFLAEQLFMSNSTLYRKMKSLTGLSTKEYISRMRMRKAEELLLEGQLSVGEIAEEVGLDNIVYFRQCFKKEFGVSPSDYLKNLKEKKVFPPKVDE